MPESSYGVGLGRITAAKKGIGVWVCRAESAIAWIRCRLVCHWLWELSLVYLRSVTRRWLSAQARRLLGDDGLHDLAVFSLLDDEL